MAHDEKDGGGSAHDRRTHRRHLKDGTGLTPQPTAIQVEDGEQKHAFIPLKQRTRKDAESKQRLNELLNLASFALGCASWAWTAIAPESSPIFGSVLLFVAVIFALLGVQRIWTVGRAWFSVAAVMLVVGFGLFDWFVVVKPQRGKPFQTLLVEGYHLTNECQAVPGKTQMPTWMRDQSKGWQARVQQLIADKLNPPDAQIWQGAVIIGRVKDETSNSYQCTWLANKVSALESIIAAEYDPKLKHREYTGPTYWFDATDGKVDISDAFKNGNNQANVVLNGDSEDALEKSGKPTK